MKYFTATTNIKASPDAIWKILTDAPNYPTWDPGVLRIEGTIAPGQKLTAYPKANPNRAFPSKVTDFVPGQKMTWTGGMPLGLFKGERTFTLVPRDKGAVEFTVREIFRGLSLPLIGRSIPDMTTPFEQFVSGLKNRVERGR